MDRKTPVSAYSHHYLPIPDDLLHSGMYVTSVGRSVVAPGAPYPAHQHPSLYHFSWEQGRTLPEFSLLLVAKGSGLLETREIGRTRLKEGNVVLVFPGVWHRYRPDPETGWMEKWVHFNGKFAHTLMEQNLITPLRPVLEPADPEEVGRSLDRLLGLVDEAPTSNSLKLSLLAMGALGLALGSVPVSAPRSPRRQKGTAGDPVVEAAIDYIWTRSHKVLSVPDVAAALGITRRTLERRMMATTGHSVLDEIIGCRFSRAERLLRETDLPVRTIVDLAGFGSTENFRQVFVKRVGMSPAAYRAQYRHFPNGEGESPA
ncbi:AraC family transcriptional regulator [Luteolibacter sp. LG18]|uniref:AraC family transcriptional regulator n=1 Tax=Luteolibacter sp. LG18 TaxID=2819286 RepID=UPI002B288BD7|nr:AraC family transcriptional regulator [Luteolibacter sp. LG18]